MHHLSDIHFMSLAIEQAQIAFSKGEVPIGALVVQDQKIISKAFNQIEELQDPSAHAEILAIREASRSLGKWRLDDCEIYVTVEPCPMCLGAIRLSRIKRLVVGTLESRMGALSKFPDIASDNSLGPIPEIFTNVLAEESASLMRNFFAELRKSK